MTCKDCIHYDVCKRFNSNIPEEFEGIENHCDNFKDKSLVLDLPCKVGDTVYYREGSRLLMGVVRNLSINMKEGLYIVYVNSEYSLIGIERFGFHMFGNRIFLTKEAAEQALKEREQG